MDDLISRQEALNALGEEPLVWNGWWKLYKNKQWRKDVEAIKSVPSARVEPKKGKWEETEVIAGTYGISGVKTWASKMMCDQCGFTTFAIEGHFSQYNFCPNCGADMRGENR